MTGTITVKGEGTANAVPDLLDLLIGIETRRAGAAEAFSELGRTSQAVVAVLRDSGVGDRGLRTGGLGLRAEIVWQDGVQRVSGYVASTQLSARLRTWESAAAIIGSVVSAGGDDTRINGLEPGFANPAAVALRARELAWADALAKAEQLASLAGSRLGRVVTIDEGPPAPSPVPVALARAAAVESVDLEAGEASVSATVTVCWDLHAGP